MIEYNWDDSLLDVARTHLFSKVIKKCSAHSHLSDPELWARLMDENPRKNRGLQAVLDNIPGMEIDDIGWAYDENRVLVINLPEGKCTVPQVNALTGQVAKTFGVGKVRVNRM